MTEKQINDETESRILSMVAQISEVCSSVQISASRVNIDGDTVKYSLGSGDWYARRGLAQDFLDSGTASDQADFIAQAIDQTEGDE